MKKSKLVLLSALAVVLAGGVGVQIYATKKYPAVSTLRGTSLAEVLPEESSTWTYEDVPVAQSDAAIGNVEKILRYDDVAFRRYRKGDVSVDVYVAYWEPRKMSYWDVGSHNPDSCWVYNGFERVEREHGVVNDDPALPLKPFEYGRYNARGGNIDVMFWHLVGGRPNRYEEQREGWRNGLAGRIERAPLMLKDIKTYGLNMHQEQYFVRISSARSLPTLLQDESFRTLLKELAPLGILEQS